MSPAIHNHSTPGGEKIEFKNGKLMVPNRPVIPFIEGDGTGPDIWRASRQVFDAAVKHSYGGKREIQWMEVLAGERAKKLTGEWLSGATLRAIGEDSVSVKRPLTNAFVSGIR